MSKPREFWIMLAPKIAAVCAVKQKHTPDGAEQVHVIEKSAADKLADALDSLPLGLIHSVDHYDCDNVAICKSYCLACAARQALKEYRGTE